MVFLAERHALGPPAAALVQISNNVPELDQLVILQPLCQGDVVKVVISIDRRSPRVLIILLFHQQVVERLIHTLVVVALN